RRFDGERADHAAFLMAGDGAVELVLAGLGVFRNGELGGFAVVQHRGERAAPVIDREVVLQEAGVGERNGVTRLDGDLGFREREAIERFDLDRSAARRSGSTVTLALFTGGTTRGLIRLRILLGLRLRRTGLFLGLGCGIRLFCRRRNRRVGWRRIVDGFTGGSIGTGRRHALLLREGNTCLVNGGVVHVVPVA